MSCLEICISLLLVTVAAKALNEQEEWVSFKTRYSKTYNNIMEENMRLQIFRKNLLEIEKHNRKFEKGETSFQMGVTQFTDLSKKEFMEISMVNISLPEYSESDTFHAISENDMPKHFDWREKKGVVPNLRIQYYCSAYYAMSSVSAIESQVFLKQNRTVRLSEQEILECSASYENKGCTGGGNSNALKYILDNGIAYQKDYVFKRYVEECKNKTIPKSDIKIKGYTKITEDDEMALQQALVTNGPISVLFFNEFAQNYVSGIVDISYCPRHLWDHGGLLVGYGTENNTDYWIVQDYFGQQWGENGYFRLARNKESMCGIAYQAYYPSL